MVTGNRARFETNPTATPVVWPVITDHQCFAYILEALCPPPKSVGFFSIKKEAPSKMFTIFVLLIPYVRRLKSLKSRVGNGTTYSIYFYVIFKHYS
jgi:hypothetical protein